VNAVVGADVGAVVALEVGDRLGQGEVEVLAHHRAHLATRPVARVRRMKEVGDLARVPVPGDAVPFHRGLVAGLCAGEQVGGDDDVLLEQRGQLLARGAAVERLDRVADVAAGFAAAASSSPACRAGQRTRSR
jgi:hypothetical protein